jgi:hypothetical protein
VADLRGADGLLDRVVLHDVFEGHLVVRTALLTRPALWVRADWYQGEVVPL